MRCIQFIAAALCAWALFATDAGAQSVSPSPGVDRVAATAYAVPIVPVRWGVGWRGPGYYPGNYRPYYGQYYPPGSRYYGGYGYSSYYAPYGGYYYRY